VDDLIGDLTQWLEEGEHIIVGLDLNKHIGTAPFSQRLLEISMTNLLLDQYASLPATYIRGTLPIDGVYISAQLQGCLGGYLPFLGDHRPAWIDVPESIIFLSITVTAPRARRLTLQDPRIVNKYTAFLQEFSGQHNLLFRSEQLYKRLDYNHPLFVEEYNAIDHLRVQGMLAAEKQCRKLRMGATPFSPQYSILAKKVLEADFNQNNKRLGCQAMYLAEKYNAIAVEQFGCRKRMSAIDQSLNKALTFDLWRQFRTPGAICSSDLCSC
jgi:hypothetical protein